MTINIDSSMALVSEYLQQLQDNICHALSAEDDKATFNEDAWQHKTGGGGKTRVISNGNFIEKGGVNFSHIRGNQLPQKATDQRSIPNDCEFQATGVSLVIHPDNPFVPTAHANVRFIVVTLKDKPSLWWFGGGIDLTPYYGFTEDAIHWHKTAKKACDPFGGDVYTKYKKWCDEYFFLKHRNEARGIGGLFFDDLNDGGFEQNFKFMQSVGDHFLEAYLPIVQRRKNTEFTEQQKAFQRYRRGRYVEFNLLYDRGTIFGIQSNGRTESILMSLPPEVTWEYAWTPEPNSAEAKLYSDFLPAQDWLAQDQ